MRFWRAPPKWLHKSGLNAIAGANLPAASGLLSGIDLPQLVQIGTFFMKAGAFVFGSGLAIVPFLYGGVVTEHSRRHALADRARARRAAARRLASDSILKPDQHIVLELAAQTEAGHASERQLRHDVSLADLPVAARVEALDVGELAGAAISRDARAVLHGMRQYNGGGCAPGLWSSPVDGPGTIPPPGERVS